MLIAAPLALLPGELAKPEVVPYPGKSPAARPRTLAPGVLEELDTFVRRTVELYRRTRVELAQVFRAIGMEPILPAGAFYMLVKHHRASDLAATQELLDKKVAVAPGAPFFSRETDDTGTIRIHFAVSPCTTEGTGPWPETVAEVRRRLLS